MYKKIVAAVLCLALAAAALCSCSSSAEVSASPEASTAEPSAQAVTEAPTVSAQTSVNEDTEQTGAVRSMTDMAGRSVDIPETISKVYATTPVGSIYVYTLDPEKLLGWNYALNDWEKKYIQEEYQDLPVYGMGDNLNLEALIAAKPDVILQIAGLGDKAKEQAEALSEQTGIPVLMYSLDLVSTPAVYEHLGILLGEQDRAGTLAEYSAGVIRDAQEKAEQIPEDERVTVYYGNGADSLNTAPQGSDAAEVFELAGGVNCAAMEMTEDSMTERVDISPEQLLAWNPDIIFVNGEPKDELSAQSAAEAILENPAYQSLQAVADKKVYGIPQTPFSWLDRPKSSNRIIGVLWSGALMYPDLYADTDLTQAVQDFYSLFYHVDLTPEQVVALPSE